MQTTKNKRLDWVDVIRCLAILAVVMCHSVEGDIYILNVEFMQTVGMVSKLFAFIAFALGRIGVPFFLLMSGYLLLDREYDDNACRHFWKNKWIGILLAVELWIVVYNAFSYFFYGEFSIVSLVKELLWLKESPMNHMWYMPMIVGLYLTLPIAANAIRKLDIKTILVPYIIILICTLVVPTMNVFCWMLDFDMGYPVISTGFSGGLYGVYLITGYLIKKGILKKVSSCWLGGTGILCFVLAVFQQVASYSQGTAYNVYYDNLFIFLCGALGFELLSRVKTVPCKKMFWGIAKYSFAIYLVHKPINLLLKTIPMLEDLAPLRVMVVWFGTIVCSYVVVYLINKIPKFGKAVLYMR